MNCWIYKSLRKAETYLFLKDKDGFATVPDALLRMLGEMELVMELELHPQRRLARADAGAVLAQLDAQGYFLQLPPIEPERIRPS